MKTNKFLLTLSTGVLVGFAGHWYMLQPASQDLIAAARSESPKQSFDGEKLKAEPVRTGRTVRKEASKAGEAIADATASARITAVIKAKLLADAGLSAFKIDVDTTDGVVTLSGTVASPEDIAHAINLARAVNGVQQVVSTLLANPN